MNVGVNVEDKTGKKGAKTELAEGSEQISMVDGVESLVEIQGEDISTMVLTLSIANNITKEVKSGKNMTSLDRTSLVRVNDVGKNELEASGNSLSDNFIVRT